MTWPNLTLKLRVMERAARHARAKAAVNDLFALLDRLETYVPPTEKPS